MPRCCGSPAGRSFLGGLRAHFVRMALAFAFHVPPALQRLNLGEAADEERHEKVYDFVLAPFDLQSDAHKCRIATIGDGRSLILAGTVLQSDGLTRRNLFRRVQKFLESGSRALDSADSGWAEVLRHRVAVERQRHSEDLERLARASGAPYRAKRAMMSSWTAHHGALRDHASGMVIGAVAQALRRMRVKHDGIAVPYANRSTPSEWSGLGCFTDTILIHPRLELGAGGIAADIERQIAAGVKRLRRC